MITKDGVTYPGNRDELLATGRWRRCQCGGSDCNAVIDNGRYRFVSDAIAEERDRALVARAQALEAALVEIGMRCGLPGDATPAEIVAKVAEQAALVTRYEAQLDAHTLSAGEEIERLQADRRALGATVINLTARLDQQQAEIERLRAQVPTRERVIQLLSDATCFDEEWVEDVLRKPYADDQCVAVQAIARLLGLDVRDPADGGQP